MSNAEKISLVLKNTTNSYKYYWWYAIIRKIKDTQSSKFSFDELANQMLIFVWYPINYFKISLGRQDQLSKYISQIKAHYQLPDDICEQDLHQFFLASKHDKFISNIVNAITRYVPYRFIRPWFPELVGLKDSEINSSILLLQDVVPNKPPYYINAQKKQIELNGQWREWIQSNLKIILNYTFYELFKYVEKNNPNVTNISAKLFKPESRNLTAPIKLWKGFIKKDIGNQTVIENKLLNQIEDISIDHFLPWSFLTHDLLWNLHPMEKRNNSAKGNKLPHKNYITRFCELQFDFVKYLEGNSLKQLEDYNLFFSASNYDFETMSKSRFTQEFTNLIKPQFQIAKNMGFESNWQLI